jgi:hypothetical protein
VRTLLTPLAAALFTVQGLAQAPATPPLFIKGTLNINFDTVAQANPNGKPAPGVTDKYAFDLNVANSVVYHGTIVRLPNIPGALYGTAQEGSLTFDVDCSVVNPRNPAQTKNIGKMAGLVPVDKNNVYHFGDGTLGINTFSIGMAVGTNSKFSGLALGKPPANTGALAKLKKQVINITRSVHGQTVTIPVTNYDRMDFQSHVLAGGPVQIYPEVTVNGSMLYDYDRNAWHFQGVNCSYFVGGRQIQDTLTGDIRWIEDPNRSTNGNGEYDFDVRINEPPPSEASAFAAPTSESDFFATDDSITGLTGTMKYHDTIVGDYKDDNVTVSAVQVDLTANKLTKQQVMYLCKLLLFSAVVPMNSE